MALHNPASRKNTNYPSIQLVFQQLEIIIIKAGGIGFQITFQYYDQNANTHTHSHSWKEFTLASFSVVGNRQSGIFMLECGAIHPLYILLSINLDAKMSVRTQMYSVTVLVGGWVQQKLSIVTPSNQGTHQQHESIATNRVSRKVSI